MENIVNPNKITTDAPSKSVTQVVTRVPKIKEFVCQSTHITNLYIVDYKVSKNQFGKFIIFCIGK